MPFLAEYEAVPEADAARRVALVSGWIRTDPKAFFAELREDRPIFKTPAFTLVTRYQDVVSILNRNSQFSVRLYAGKMDDVVGPFMLGRDNAVQNYRDKSIMHMVLPMSDLGRVRSLTGSITESLLTHRAKEVDVVKVISRAVPIGLCGEYFGFPGPNAASMHRWSKATQTDFFKNIGNNAAVHEEAIACGRDMSLYLRTLFEERARVIDANPGVKYTTTVDRLIHLCRHTDTGLDVEALLTNIAGLLVGSVETTSQAVAQSLQQILVRPEVRSRAIQAVAEGNESLLSAITWEALRLNPINPLLFRYTEEDTLLGDGTPEVQSVEKGTVVFACTASAMWDDKVIPDASGFVIGRPSFSYLHFGHGSHECLGKYLALVMVPEMIRVLLARNARLPDGASGKIDFEGGPFPESFKLLLDGIEN